MSQVPDYNLSDQLAKTFREELNLILSAVVSNSNGDTEPTTTHPFMFWVDTQTNEPILKMRNAANNAWINIGRADLEALGLRSLLASNGEPVNMQAFMLWVDTSAENGDKFLKIRNAANNAWISLGNITKENFGFILKSGGNFSGSVSFDGKDYILLPRGTTAERPANPVAGMIRHNTELGIFEGYQNEAWGPLGGGAYDESELQSLNNGAIVNISTTKQRQVCFIQGNGANVTISNFVFGNVGGWKHMAEVTLICLGDYEVTIPCIDRVNEQNDCVTQNGDVILKYGSSISYIYSTTKRRWFEATRNT